MRYRTGLPIKTSGIYLVHHRQHRLPHEVTLLAGHTFPPCAKCNETVEFELIMGVSDAKLTPFRVVLHQIPELPENAAAAAAASDDSEEKTG